MNGHTSSFIVGDNQGVDPTGGQATGVGNKGSVLYVRDAGYGVSTSPSYQKQFVYTYNSLGQKATETNLNGTVTQYSYGDQWGNLTQVVQDPHVTQGDGHLARTTGMLYDSAGRVLQSTDPMGRTSSFGYNSLGQPTSAAFPATGSAPAETIGYTYGTNGRTQSVTDNRGTTTLAYENGCDRVSSVTDPVTGAIAYTYGVSGERRTMTLPGGGVWTYAYFGDGTPNNLSGIESKDDPNSISPMLTTITDDQGRQAEYHLDLLGAPHEIVTAQLFDANLSRIGYLDTFYNYDRIGDGSFSSHRRLQTLANTWNTPAGQGQWHSAVLVQNAYTYDLSGQRLSNAISDVNGLVRTELYGYDELNRLKTVDYGDGQTQSYAFDAMGNRTSKTDVGGGINGTEGYTFNAANMLLTRAGNSYTNDLAGNTLTGGGRTNTWDSQNRLVSCVNGANTSSFVYGADGLRRQSTVNSVTADFLLDNRMFVRERNHSTGAGIATYLVGARGPEYRRDDVSGAIRWYLYDGLGSVLGEVDPNGTITSSRKFDVYGAIRGGINPSGTSQHKFVGQLGHPSEDETGLTYMRARYYDPAAGRFANQDPKRDGINWYTYCLDNPVNCIDESGEAPSPAEIIRSIEEIMNRYVDAEWTAPLVWIWKLRTARVFATGLVDAAIIRIEFLIARLCGEAVDQAVLAEVQTVKSERDTDTGDPEMGAMQAEAAEFNGCSAADKIDAVEQLGQLIEELLISEGE
jgi:RHS repeat-associated protein